MKTEEIQNLFQKFEQITTEIEGIECWVGALENYKYY